MRNISLSLLVLFGMVASLSAREPVGVKPRVRPSLRTAAECLPPTASAQLDVNNIRTLLHNGGDMWWDLVGSPRYEVPKGSNLHSLFAGSLWVGGIDDAGQLRVAAQTYRQSGVDFWPGPLTDQAAETEEETCTQFDRMFKINKAEIDEFRADFSAVGSSVDLSKYPNVRDWPTGTKGEWLNTDGGQVQATLTDGSTIYLAPWVEVGGSGNDEFTYDPKAGDYPRIRGDQAIWWVINDKGDVHTETGGEPIGVEIHMMAFAFTTANAVNNMTFYDQIVINRSNQTLTNTFIGQWVDADIGFFRDDYVACDTTLGLGMAFNGDADDEGNNGYGTNPPAVGIDFFQGPEADPNDEIDNDKDGIVDEPGETIIMSKFVYYNNDFSLTGNPEVANHYYGYLRGFWKDGTPIVDNYTNGGSGNGYGPSSAGDPTDYMFWGDPCANTGWTEQRADNPPADRRFIQSAGPFTLTPGKVNQVITGAVWARGFYQDQIGSVCELQRADKIAQALFDNNFTLLDGPDAPEVAYTELNREVLINWGYGENSRGVRNNFNESYVQADPVLKAEGVADSTFAFQGYIVYQLVDNTVSTSELNDAERARIVAQCDIKDGVSAIINTTEQAVEGLSSPIIVDEVMVQGNDDGLFNSINITEDLFAQSDNRLLKNYTTYYYAVIAYAYNDTSSDGRQFVPGNRFFRVIPAMPHPTEFERRGQELSADYGLELPVTQVAGIGNGGRFVRLDSLTEEAILENNQVNELNFESGGAPIVVKVIDPKILRESYYQVQIVRDEFLSAELLTTDLCGDVIDSTFVSWRLYESQNENGPFTGDPIFEATYIKRGGGCEPDEFRPDPLVGNERVIQDRGISIEINNPGPSGDTTSLNTGVVGGEYVFDDPNVTWLTGLPDINEFFNGVWDWSEGGPTNGTGKPHREDNIYDPEEDYSKILTGWSPFSLARSFNNSVQDGGLIGPGVQLTGQTSFGGISRDEVVSLDDLPDVDIVFTSDVTKWSKCMVVETSPNSSIGSGAWQLSGKWADNIEDPLQIANNPDNPGTEARSETRHGFSWFPGYAIDVQTGTRLNLFFGESTWDITNRGDDMIWNPTSNVGSRFDEIGGRHYIYVTNRPYDEFASLQDTLTNGTDVSPITGTGIGGFGASGLKNMADIYKYVTWVGIPLISPVYDYVTGPSQIPTRARVSLRVNQPFDSREGANDIPTFNFSTAPFAAKTELTDVATSALEEIRVVPNPYYAYSSYETGQLSNVIKITNLPQRCDINIYSLNGNLVRTFRKDSDSPEQTWDLKNQSGVQVGSGPYIIHVDAGDLGIKVVKMVAVMRRIDLNSF
ncbi:MAG: T9SS type A sorting domain-containing protein [Bacteroidia bacterium]